MNSTLSASFPRKSDVHIWKILNPSTAWRKLAKGITDFHLLEKLWADAWSRIRSSNDSKYCFLSCFWKAYLISKVLNYLQPAVSACAWICQKWSFQALKTCKYPMAESDLEVQHTKNLYEYSEVLSLVQKGSSFTKNSQKFPNGVIFKMDQTHDFRK